ncbi:MAG UNVERIFIED_CONTAM: pilus assembly protein [Planctomycetaceae bacterium]|jgi:Flp pilus assembly protein TadG
MRRQPTTVVPSSSPESNPGTSHRKPRRGASAIEFAIVLPVMAAVLAGTADYGRFAATSIAVCNASRAGAGYGCIHPWDSYTSAAFMTACRSKVEEEFSAVPGFDPQQLQIQIFAEGTWPNNRVRVAVNYPFETVINWGFLPSSVPVSRTTVLPMVR